jgi:cobalt-zinc-cadmium resistance protein CzcA
MLFAAILAPVLADLASGGRVAAARGSPIEEMKARYRHALAHCLRRPRAVGAATALVLVGCIIAGMTVERDFIPDLDEGALMLQAELPSGISLEKAREMASELRRALGEFPEVAYAATEVGRSNNSTDLWTTRHIEAAVGLKSYSDWPSGESREGFIGRLLRRLVDLPGIETSVTQTVADRVSEALHGAHASLIVKVFGDDPKAMRQTATRIVDAIGRLDGAKRASIAQEPPTPQVAFHVDRKSAARYGVNVADISNLIQVGVGGASIGEIRLNDRNYDMTVRYPLKARSSPEALKELFVKSASNTQVSLAQISSVSLKTDESVISRENGRRSLTVRAETTRRNPYSFFIDAQGKVADAVRRGPATIWLAWSGRFEDIHRAGARLVILLGLVWISIIAILYFALGSLWKALPIVVLTPFAGFGGLVALHATGQTLNVVTGVGFLVLMGVAAQSGIIMLYGFRDVTAADAGPASPRSGRSDAQIAHAADDALRGRLLEAAVGRFTLLVSASALPIVGMAPAALATGVGCDFQRGLGVVVVGGQLVAALSTMFALPTMYFLIQRFVAGRMANAAPARESA